MGCITTPKGTKTNGSVQRFLWCTKVGKMDFVHGIILVHEFRTGILKRFY